MENVKVIYDGDVKARADKALKELKEVCFDVEAIETATTYVLRLKSIKRLYKHEGWKAVAELIADINQQCWILYNFGYNDASEFYAKLYHAACAWYQGYPANAYEEEHANEKDGSFEHICSEDVLKIYRYLD